MGIEKEGSKSGGGYVGGFFQLFDWTAKSRKKLFSSKSDLQELSKQGKGSDGSLPRTRLRLMDDDDIGAGSSIRGGSDYSCASSVTDDEGYGARAPGVVARLMGLDSIDAYRGTGNFDFYHDHQITYSGNLLTKEDGPPRNLVKSKSQKVLSRPIEKFQTEILPPKSAKSIPSTHHKLLSPIKSPGFIPSKTAAHIMEAAAKIIVPSPQAVTKATLPALGSSSLPLKVRDLKEKLEVAQKMPLVRSSSATTRTREAKEKVEASHKTLRLAETSRRPAESSAAKHLKGQSLNRSWNGSDDASYRVFSETDEDSSSSKTKGKSISLAIQAKVNVQRREGLNASGSQGFVGQKEQAEVSSSQRFKSQPNFQKSSQKRSPIHKASGALRQNNQKQNCMMDKEKLPSKPLVSNLQGKKVLSGNPPARLRAFEGTSNYSSRSSPRKKRSIDGNLHHEKNQVADKLLTDRNRKAVGTNPVIDRHFSWVEESKRKGMDVVSFTFTAPLTRSTLGSETPTRAVQKKSDSCTDNRSKRLWDALSTLLEQKLSELTKTVESSSSLSTFSSGGTAPRLHDNKDQSVPCIDRSDNYYDCRFSTDPAALRLKRILQQLLNCRRPSPVSVLEHSFSNESRSRHCSSIQVQEVHSLSSSKKFHFLDVDMELSDSASSSSAGTVDRKHANMLAVTGLARSTKWEIEYVKKILCNIEPMRKDTLESDGADARLERKVLFDCASECLDLRCRRHVSGGYKAWEWLGEDLCKEILEWSSMGDCMVDELVDKDMSSQYGRWLDFEVFNSLVNEVVADMLRF
ncbi:DUF4378 domain-containing protein/VARLMGL domain-containing protein [Salix suchowensis]|nr:DUF4378 domain-containing protein/VARLMGL domain-containing protein [Salix suchowensis]